MTHRPSKPNPPLALRLRVLSAIDYAPGNSIRERIKQVAQRTFSDEQTGHDYIGVQCSILLHIGWPSTHMPNEATRLQRH